MRIYRSLSDIPVSDRGATVAIGNFDGVHLGHQVVIERARQAHPNAPLAVLTFEPHPREVFQPDTPAFRLMNPTARANRLQKLGVDILFELPFDEALRALTPEDFCKVVLADGFGAGCITVGADFMFGAGRKGTVETLRRQSAELGFDVQIVELVDHGETNVSSTAIRVALAEGKPQVAAAMLGHWHRIEGPVLHGEKRGRELGYPTANLALDGLHLPALGVYAVEVAVQDGPHAGDYRGVASLGVRPMFGENAPNLETFLFDFSGDLYGAALSVALVAYLRGEENFEDLDTLITQMDKDSAQARSILEKLA